VEPLLTKRMLERKEYPPYEVLRPMTDKMARARPLQGRMQQGRVYFPEEASWRAVAEKEFLRFPAGVHDDIVDATAWAVHLALTQSPPRLDDAPKPLPSWKDKLFGMLTGGGSHMSA
jgi:phage terminase large subunit-like protein